MEKKLHYLFLIFVFILALKFGFRNAILFMASITILLFIVIGIWYILYSIIKGIAKLFGYNKK